MPLQSKPTDNSESGSENNSNKPDPSNDQTPLRRKLNVPSSSVTATGNVARIELNLTDTQETEPDESSLEEEQPTGSELSLQIMDPELDIWKAAEKGDLQALQHYIETSEIDRFKLVNTRDPESEYTLLYIAITNNRHPLALMEILLENGADPLAQNVYKIQAIHAVSLYCPNPFACIELLISHEADPNARDGDGWTPLHYICRFCERPLPCMQLLVKHGANVNHVDVNNKTAAFMLLANGDCDSGLDWLIHAAGAKAGVRGEFLDQETRTTYRGTLVSQAVKYGRLRCLSKLVGSSVATEDLKETMTREELDRCFKIVRQQINDRDKSTDWKEMERLLQTLKNVLIDDPNSLILCSLSLLGADATPRRLSLLNSLRRRRRSQANKQQSPKPRRPSIMERVLNNFRSTPKDDKSNNDNSNSSNNDENDNDNNQANNNRNQSPQHDDIV